MLLLMAGTVLLSVYYDTLKPNPGLTAHPVARTYQIPSATAPGGKRAVTLPAVAGLPVDQHLGNLEGKEMRFGTSAGATYAAITTDVTCGAVNAEADSLNPMAGLSPMIGMWLNCIFGGKGVGMINMLMYVIIGIFVAGMMVGQDARVPGQEDRGPRGQARDHRPPGPSVHDSYAHRALRRDELGTPGREQPRRPWFLTDALPVLLGLGQ